MIEGASLTVDETLRVGAMDPRSGTNGGDDMSEGPEAMAILDVPYVAEGFWTGA